jgi:polyisoprenoid-binding protein YceI
MKTLKSVLIAVTIFATTGLFAQQMKVDVEKSNLEWHGKKVTGEHDGTIDLKDGWFTWSDNKITEGEFVINMTSIKNSDIDDLEYRAKLEGHLKSDDFFGVETYPTATLKVKGSDAFKNNEAQVKGHLTIKGITHPVEFTATKNGMKFMAEIVVDRSKYDVRYGSGSFFDNLGDRMIYDDFTMKVSIHASEMGSASID